MTVTFLLNHKAPINEWQSLSKKQSIPKHLQSQQRKQGEPVLALGVVKSMVAILTSKVQGEFKEKNWSVQVESTSETKKDSTIHYAISGDEKQWSIQFPETHHLALAGFIDAHTAQRQEATEFLERWEKLIDELEAFLTTKAPFNVQQLQEASRSNELNDLFLTAADSLYCYLEIINNRIKIIKSPPPSQSNNQTILFQELIFSRLQKKQNNPLIKNLRRIIKDGRTALLIGGTGVGKTEAVKTAAIIEQKYLVKVAGHPALDDRQLFGATYPDGKGGFIYVEGPVSEAFDYAASGKSVVLLIDELARMDPIYHALLIGNLDCYTAAEIRLRQRFLDALQCELKEDEYYYGLLLPNGKILIAPCSKLSIIATSNLGRDYQQLTSQFDAALLGRFNEVIEVETLSFDTRVRALSKVPLVIAQMMVRLEDFTTKHTAANGSLLARGSNLRVLINWEKATASIISEDPDITWKQALLEASQTTIIPFVCPRLNDGSIEEVAKKMIIEELERLFRTIKL